MCDSLIEKRAREYLDATGQHLDRKIGFGQDGIVWVSDRGTAIKALEREKNYRNEVSCYQRLKQHSITKLHGFSIPRLIGFDDSLLVVEMDWVRPPFLLDFGKAHVDFAPDFSAEVWREWQAQRKELFGTRWPIVLKLTSALKQYGIYYYDVTPGNDKFRRR